MLGGSSGVNAMVYFRGFPEDFNHWESLGNSGWGYDMVRQSYERIEDSQDRNASTAVGGPLKLNYYSSSDRVREVFRAGMAELGYPSDLKDFNADDRIGFTYSQGNLHRGIRESSARSYLIPAANRHNLHVLKYSQVTSLIIEGNRVQGVNFISGNRKYEARASREVILSAGSIGSPQILLNSGVGPKAHLEEVGISLIHDLSVGENLQDHIMVAQHFQFEKLDGEISESELLDHIYLYFKNRTGPLSTPISPDFNGFFNSEGNLAGDPDFQTQHIIFEKNSLFLRRDLHLRRYKEKYIRQLEQINRRMTIAIVYVVVARPESRGWIRLRDTNPTSKPIIIPNYFGDVDGLDMKTAVGGLSLYKELVETEAFKDNGGEFIYFDDFECKGLLGDSYWECYARFFTSTLYHPSGTTKMGPTSDHSAVVDQKLRVHGMEHLRVCDAGIQPTIVSVNTNGVSMMIGERCSQFIKEQYEEERAKLQLSNPIYPIFGRTTS